MYSVGTVTTATMNVTSAVAMAVMICFHIPFPSAVSPFERNANRRGTGTLKSRRNATTCVHDAQRREPEVVRELCACEKPFAAADTKYVLVVLRQLVTEQVPILQSGAQLPLLPLDRLCRLDERSSERRVLDRGKLTCEMGADLRAAREREGVSRLRGRVTLPPLREGMVQRVDNRLEQRRHAEIAVVEALVGTELRRKAQRTERPDRRAGATLHLEQGGEGERTVVRKLQLITAGIHVDDAVPFLETEVKIIIRGSTR